jgi:hypothetical protein
MYCIAQRRVLPELAEKERQLLLKQAHLHTLVELLEAIPDPRGKHGLRYDLPFLLTCLIAALWCHCNSTQAVSECVPGTRRAPARTLCSASVFDSEWVLVSLAALSDQR